MPQDILPSGLAMDLLHGQGSQAQRDGVSVHCRCILMNPIPMRSTVQSKQRTGVWGVPGRLCHPGDRQGLHRAPRAFWTHVPIEAHNGREWDWAYHSSKIRQDRDGLSLQDSAWQALQAPTV